MKINKFLLISTLAAVSLTLSACGSKTATPEDKPIPVAVKSQTVAQSLSVKQSLTYPGTVVAESEATLSAKTSGNLTGVNFKIGDQVTLGQELAKIDDVNSPSFNASNFNSNQIKQAKLSASQAEAAYNLARDSYNNLLVSSVKDLRSAEIARDQAASGQTNLDLTAAESLKSATLAYETAKIVTAQAKSTLDNRQKLADQSAQDTKDNAALAADTVANTCNSLLININNLTGLDANNSVTVPYSANLGALDGQSLSVAKDSYQSAKDAYSSYQAKKFNSINEKVTAAKVLADVFKKLSDDVKYLFDKTVTSNILPPSSLTGNSLSNLQSAAAGYQTQMSAALSQINGTSQALTNVGLNNASLLDSLRQAYELAKQQEASAGQALNNLQAGSVSQKDQANFAYNLAQNQYDNLKIKIESQVAGAKTQMETAELQYNNATVALQSLYDAHSVVSPLNGTITKVFVSAGEAVNPGQAIATISQVQNIKVQFYVEADNLLDIKLGLPVTVIDDNNTNYAGIIAAVSPQADLATRRFLVEVKLENSSGLFLGTLVTVKVDIYKTVNLPGWVILPLAAVTVGQNGSFIFVVDNNQAKKVAVEIKEVVGELAKVKVDLPAETNIIIEGNKLLQEGTAISQSK
ncbi:MAG: efflux RND transporter periplasmic adaptor subunit [Patescibacteria group bacterium]|jgi:membrane fusion protein (multidrug efflux system)